MNTAIYFIRHAESPYSENNERIRGLSEKGQADAKKVRDILISEDIDIMFSSPYERAIQTINELANDLNNKIIVEEDLRERKLAGADFIFDKHKFFVLNNILDKNEGKRIAIGTHGDIMTLMMNYFAISETFDPAQDKLS